MVAHEPESILNVATKAPKPRCLPTKEDPGDLRKLASNNTSAAGGVSDRFDFDYRLNGVDVIGRRLAEATRCRSWNGADSVQTPCNGAILLRVNNQYNRRGDLVYQKSHLDVDSLQYDASGNITRKYSTTSPAELLIFTMLAKTNRLQKDYNPIVPYTVNHHYDANGADTLNMPTVGNQGTAELWRWMYYDGLGRMSGYKQGKWIYGAGYISFGITGTACRYDADGQLYLPCNQTAPQLSFDGSNVIGANTGWRFIHAPGVDEPLIARYENYAGVWLRELYFVTDGQGRQLSVGDKKGYIHEGDFSTDGSGWRYSGAARNASGFGAERLGPGAMPGVSMFRNRAYDSRTGRWTQEDPIGVAGGLNLYQFNGNDPVAYTDPFGLCPDACVIEGGVGAAAVVTGLAVAIVAVAHGDDLSDAAQEGYDAGKKLVGSIFAAVSGKILEGRLAGQARNIAKHFGKLANPNQAGGEDPNMRDKWRGDIKKGIREMKKLADRLKGKAAEKWTNRIKAVEEQLSKTQ